VRKELPCRRDMNTVTLCHSFALKRDKLVHDRTKMPW
jgi:hypothetical protein